VFRSGRLTTRAYTHGGEDELTRWLVGLGGTAVSLLVLLHAGLLAFVVYEVTWEVLSYTPMTTDFAAWYARVSNLSLVVLAGLAAYGFWATCRHRLLFATDDSGD
jgi:hypothetical protein